jgi:transposase-like protein
MKQRVVIRSLPQALEMVEEMGFSQKWESDYRVRGRQALQEIFEIQMGDRISRHLEEMARCGVSDRRNGVFSRHLLTELGDIELCVPRTRRMSAVEVVRA